MTELVLIAALDRARAIGRDNTLPWALPDDLRRFKQLTLGKTVLMGRKTAISLGRTLPGRTNLVLTRGNSAPWPGMDVVGSLDEACRLAGDELCVIGGGEVYALALPHARRLHLTWVHTEIEAPDTWFPAWNAASWQETARIEHAADARHRHAFAFVDYVRR
jgi:dihydrofolate reductase